MGKASEEYVKKVRSEHCLEQACPGIIIEWCDADLEDAYNAALDDVMKEVQEEWWKKISPRIYSTDDISFVCYSWFEKLIKGMKKGKEDDRQHKESENNL